MVLGRGSFGFYFHQAAPCNFGGALFVSSHGTTSPIQRVARVCFCEYRLYNCPFCFSVFLDKRSLGGTSHSACQLGNANNRRFIELPSNIRIWPIFDISPFTVAVPVAKIPNHNQHGVFGCITHCYHCPDHFFRLEL